MYCEWDDVPPSYRIFVNNELFTEREWYHESDTYLSQILQIEAIPGEYTVRVEPLNNAPGRFRTDQFRVEYGSAEWLDRYTLLIKEKE